MAYLLVFSFLYYGFSVNTPVPWKFTVADTTPPIVALIAQVVM